MQMVRKTGRAEFGGKICSLTCRVAREKYAHMEANGPSKDAIGSLSKRGLKF